MSGVCGDYAELIDAMIALHHHGFSFFIAGSLVSEILSIPAPMMSSLFLKLDVNPLGRNFERLMDCITYYLTECFGELSIQGPDILKLDIRRRASVPAKVMWSKNSSVVIT